MEHDSSPVWGMYVAWRLRAERAEARVALLEQALNECPGEGTLAQPLHYREA